MDVQAHADGLRELADWIEENSEVFTGSDFSGQSPILLCRIDQDDFVATAQALGVEQSEVEVKSDYLYVSRSFGPLRVAVYIAADKVGTEQTKMRPTTEWEIDPTVRDALGREVVI